MRTFHALTAIRTGTTVAAIAAVILAGALTVFRAEATGTGSGNSIVTVDSSGLTGNHTSLVLDGDGNPVISYYNHTTDQLKLAHCADPNCKTGTSIVSLGAAGAFSSLVLDIDGNPVISYIVNSSKALKLAHCNDPDCVGGDESIVTVASGITSAFTSLVLDIDGNPVISYIHANLTLAHCADPDCSATVSIETVDTAVSGSYTSVALDLAGNPVISYYLNVSADLALAHCVDPDCASAPSIETVATAGDSGVRSSLALDSDGNPVIAYYELTNQNLKLAACADPNCSTAPSIATVDTGGGLYLSMALHAGHPVISYWAGSTLQADLRVAHCGNADCTAGNSIVTVDDIPDRSLGWWPSLELDQFGNPVISYSEFVPNGDLKLAHCVDPACTGVPAPTPTPTPCPDNDGDTLCDAADPDDDNDGLPDFYEGAHSCLDPLVADADADPDGDGWLNSVEFNFGTNPCVANAVGGIAELPEVAGTPLETGGSSGSNAGVLAGVVAAGAVAMGGAAWYARRRRG